MPIYLYQCEDCGEVLELELRMELPKPKGLIKKHGNGCMGLANRKFTIPGMFIPYTDQDWVVRMPGEVHRERRDMFWRRKHGKHEES